MGILGATAPLNIEEERNRWLADEKNYNPRFRYKDDGAALAAARRVEASDALLDLAVRVLEGVLKKYGSESAYHEAVWGSILTREEADAMVSQYLDDNGMTGLVRVTWSSKSLVTNFSHGVAKHAGKKYPGGCLRMVAREGYYRSARLRGLLDHELGTHFTRSYNHIKASPSPQLPSPGYFLSLASEEGLASLNTHQYLIDTSLFQPALLYWSCCRAAACSFAQLNEEMVSFVDEPGRRWIECVRAKRGLTDTSRPGGLAKDQSTFHGLVRILRFRKRLDPCVLHSLKVSLETYVEATEGGRGGGAGGARHVTPCFVRGVEEYRERLDRIAVDNGIAVHVPLPSQDTVPLASRNWAALGILSSSTMATGST